MSVSLLIKALDEGATLKRNQVLERVVRPELSWVGGGVKSDFKACGLCGVWVRRVTGSFGK